MLLADPPPPGEGDSARGSCCDGASRGNIMHGRRPTISSTKGVVAAAHPLAAQAGARVLGSGGDALPAAGAAPPPPHTGGARMLGGAGARALAPFGGARGPGPGVRVL